MIIQYNDCDWWSRVISHNGTKRWRSRTKCFGGFRDPYITTTPPRQSHWQLKHPSKTRSCARRANKLVREIDESRKTSSRNKKPDVWRRQISGALQGGRVGVSCGYDLYQLQCGVSNWVETRLVGKIAGGLDHALERFELPLTPCLGGLLTAPCPCDVTLYTFCLLSTRRILTSKWLWKSVGPEQIMKWARYIW